MNFKKYFKILFEAFYGEVTNYGSNDRKNIYSKTSTYISVVSLMMSLILILYYYYVGSFGFDKSVINYVISIRNHFLTTIFTAITIAGNFIPNTIIVIIAVFGLVMFKRKKDALFLSLNILGLWSFNSLLKGLFKRERPAGVHLVTVSDYSFPSGHAMIFMGFSLLLIYYILISSRCKRDRLLLSISLLAFGILVGFSRIYLGVHYLSDVLAGWSIAAFWVSCSIIIHRILKYT